ncbi:MAG: TolC family protein [Acidobacteria bacterium]|nr:TolC family protein [Acidobacteriota bacterium]
MKALKGRGAGWILVCLLTLAVPASLPAQTPQNSQSFLRDLSRGPNWFPSLFQPYREQPIPVLGLENSPRIKDLIRDGKLELSLSDALALAIENNLDIAVQRYVKPLSDTDLLKARAGQGLTSGGGGGGGGGFGGGVSVGQSGSFDPTVSTTFSWDRVSAPLNNIVVEGTPTSISYATAFSTTYSQLFPTGTNYAFTVAGTRRSSNTNTLFNPSVPTNFSFGLNQPLLNGFGRLPYMRNLMIAQNNQRVSEETFRLQVVNTVVAVENSYWDLAAQGESVKVAGQSLAVSQKLLADNKKQAEIGTLAPLDVVAAEAEVAGRQRDLIVAQTTLQLQETKLKNMLAKRVDPELDAARIVVTDRMPEPRDPDIPDVQDALANAMRNRPDLRQSETSLQNQGISLQFTDRSLLPTGSVFGLLAAQGLQGNCTSLSSSGVPNCPGGVLTGGAAGSLNQTFGLDFPEYAGGFSLTVPIRNRAAQADNLRAQMLDNQMQISLKRTQNQVALEVRQAVIGLVQGKAQVQAAHEATRLAQQTLDAEQKKLAAGVSTPYNVILRERDLVAAQQSEVATVASYSKALVEMDRSMGTTLDRNGILVPDALNGTLSKMPTPPFSVRGFSTQQ